MLSSTFTWSDHVEYISSKVNKNLGLLRRSKYYLPYNARLLFYNSLVLPICDYADLVWGDKDNVSLMKELQILQNKAAKLILDRSLHSSSTDALTVLRWLNLEERRKCHRCRYAYKCKITKLFCRRKTPVKVNLENTAAAISITFKPLMFSTPRYLQT